MQISAAARAAHRQVEQRHLQNVHESWNARGGVGQEKVRVRDLDVSHNYPVLLIAFFQVNVRLRQGIVLR